MACRLVPEPERRTPFNWHVIDHLSGIIQPMTNGSNPWSERASATSLQRRHVYDSCLPPTPMLKVRYCSSRDRFAALETYEIICGISYFEGLPLHHDQPLCIKAAGSARLRFSVIPLPVMCAALIGAPARGKKSTCINSVGRKTASASDSPPWLVKPSTVLPQWLLIPANIREAAHENELRLAVPSCHGRR